MMPVKEHRETIFQVIDPMDMLVYDKLYYKQPSDIMQLINRFYTFKEKRVFNDLEKLKMIPLVFKQELPAEMNICLMMILSEAHNLVKDTFTEFPYDSKKPKQKQYLKEFILMADAFTEDPDLAAKIGIGAFSAAASLYYNSNQKNDTDKLLSSALSIKTLALIVSTAYYTSFQKIQKDAVGGSLDRESVNQLRGYFEKYYMRVDRDQIKHHRNIYFILKETHKLAIRNWIDGKDEVKKQTFDRFLGHLRVMTQNHPQAEYFDRIFKSVLSDDRRRRRSASHKSC